MQTTAPNVGPTGEACHSTPCSKWGYDPDRLTAWNDDQADMMNEGTWKKETDAPTGYQPWLENNKATFKVGQVMAQASS